MKRQHLIPLVSFIVSCSSNTYAATGVASIGDKDMAIAHKAFTWTGAYVGAHLAGLMQGGNLSLAPAAESPYDVAMNPKLGGSSAIGGILLGYTHQMGMLALGLEGDVGWMNASTTVFSAKSTTPMAVWYASNQLKQDVNGHVRGRVGYPSGPLLPFVSGGLAITSAKLQVIGYCPILPGGIFPAEASKTLTGWSVGVGADYALKETIPIRFEYVYDDYGTHTLLPIADQPGETWQHRSLHLFNNTFRVAMSYKF